MWRKGNYINGQRDGLWVYYYKNSELNRKGYFKKENKGGFWHRFKKGGTVWEQHSGTYKNDVKVSD